MHEANFGPSGISSPWCSGACLPLRERGFLHSLLFQSFHCVFIWLFTVDIDTVQFSTTLMGLLLFLHADAGPVGLEWGSRSFLSSRFLSDAKKGGTRWWMRTPATKCSPLACAMDLEFSSISKGEGNPVLCLVSNSFKIRMTALCFGC